MLPWHATSREICLDRRSRGIYGSTQAVESASMCGSRGRAGGVRPSLLAAFSFPSPADAEPPRGIPLRYS